MQLLKAETIKGGGIQNVQGEKDHRTTRNSAPIRGTETKGGTNGEGIYGSTSGRRTGGTEYCVWKTKIISEQRSKCHHSSKAKSMGTHSLESKEKHGLHTIKKGLEKTLKGGHAKIVVSLSKENYSHWREEAQPSGGGYFTMGRKGETCIKKNQCEGTI